MARFGGRRFREALVGVAIIAAAAVLLNINLRSRHDNARLRSHGVVALATVTDVERRAYVSIVGGNASITPVHRVRVEFGLEDGRSHPASFDRRLSELKAGDTVKVLYDRDSPSRSTIIDSCTFGGSACDRTSVLRFGLAGFLFLAGAGILAWSTSQATDTPVGWSGGGPHSRAR